MNAFVQRTVRAALEAMLRNPANVSERIVLAALAGHWALAALPAAAQAQSRSPAQPATLALPLPLPDFELVTTLEDAPRPTRAKPARPGRVFDGPVTRDGAVAAWRGGSLVAFYDYGVNCSTVTEPACAALGVETMTDPSGFTEERTVINPADPVFLARFGQRIGAVLERLKPRPTQPLAAHIDNLGLVADPAAVRAIYVAARAEYEKRRLPPLFVMKNNMRGHEVLLADGSLKPEEVAYIICENCLTKAGGAELEAAIRNARLLQRPLVLIEFGKAKLSWQNATLEQSQGLADRMRQEGLIGFAFWGPNEDRYEFTTQIPAAQEMGKKSGIARQ